MMAWFGPGPSVAAEISRGEAEDLDKGLFLRQVVTSVRYADTAAWVTATAIARAIAPVAERVGPARDRVGVVVTSEHGPEETIASLAQAAREGYSSPLRFPAGNPASLVGVACVLMGFRGPTLNLLMPPTEGLRVAVFMAECWLDAGTADFVVAALCRRRATGRYLARAVVLGRGAASASERAGISAWMAGAPEPGVPV